MNIVIENVFVKLEQINDSFKLIINDSGSNVEIGLSREQALSLGEQFNEFDLIPKKVKDNNYYRSLAKGIVNLDDNSIQKLLRLIQSQDLIDFLWIMKNAELVKKIFKNISINAAAMLTEELEKEFKESGDPDDPENSNSELKRESIVKVIAIAAKLHAEGEIPYFEGVIDL